MRNGYLSYRHLGKAQESLHIKAVTPEPSLFEHSIWNQKKLQAKSQRSDPTIWLHRHIRKNTTEPSHDKTNKMACVPRLRSAWASAQSDQSSLSA